jgi:hypothetical protein
MTLLAVALFAGALAVVGHGLFVGMLGEVGFVCELLR